MLKHIRFFFAFAFTILFLKHHNKYSPRHQKNKKDSSNQQKYRIPTTWKPDILRFFRQWYIEIITQNDSRNSRYRVLLARVRIYKHVKVISLIDDNYSNRYVLFPTAR